MGNGGFGKDDGKRIVFSKGHFWCQIFRRGKEGPWYFQTNDHRISDAKLKATDEYTAKKEGLLMASCAIQKSMRVDHQILEYLEAKIHGY